MDTEVFVYVDIDEQPVLAGRLWARMRKNKHSASFQYDDSWLERPDSFALQPALTLGEGQFHTPADKQMFGSMGDSAPDRWGRTLMRRAERQRAAEAGEPPKAMGEIDCLLGVNDEARQGALRFSLQEGGPFLATNDAIPIPPLIELPKLLAAAEHIADDSESYEDIRLLLAPGSSLGGARPKASVRDRDGHLAIAKFPHKEDDTNIVRWESVALALARNAGISVADFRIESISDKDVILIRRFDREGNRRIPFLSAMSMLDAIDNEPHSYLEFVDALRQHGARPEADMSELWRRIVFSILISNSDDHLRNHGFMSAGPDGWVLSPAYDINPVPTDIRPRVLTTAINEDDGTASLDLALEVSPYFELEEEQAKQIAKEVGDVVSQWRQVATNTGINVAQQNRMASAFDHEDLKAACSF